MSSTAFYMATGFEFRNFIYSGLWSELCRPGEGLLLRRPFDSSEADRIAAAHSLNVVSMPRSLYEHERGRADRWHTGARRARERLSGDGNFNYFQHDRGATLKDRVAGSDIVNRILRNLALREVSTSYLSTDVQVLLRDLKVRDLLVAGYSDLATVVLAQSALRMGIRVSVVMNSWKDLYVNGFVPFSPTSLFTWSDGMTRQLRAANPHLAKVSVCSSGNPAFARHADYRPRRTVAEYAEKYGFERGRPILLHSLLSPRAYPAELAIIELIDRQLSEKWPDQGVRPLVLLRRNPIDDEEYDLSRFEAGNVRVADHFWETSYEDAVYVQSEEGEAEWLDLLTHAAVNTNVASTVTLESLLMGVPVVNVEFSGSGEWSQELSRFAAAPFYRPLRGCEDVIVARKITEFLDAVAKFLRERPVRTLPGLVGPVGPETVGAIANRIRGLEGA